MSALLLWCGLAQAGSVYVNGVRADNLKDYELNDVNVRFDEKGNVWIEAPRYQVAAPAAAAATPAPTAAALPARSWWVVSEDNGSANQHVDISVNGNPIRPVRSGEKPAVIDISAWLRYGANTIVFSSRPGAPEGGAGNLYVHIGKGSDQNGTLTLQQPAFTLIRRPDEAGRADVRTFELSIPAP